MRKSRPAPLSTFGAEVRTGSGGAWRWLRTRLLSRATASQSAATAPQALDTLAGFPPALGRGHALRVAHRELHRIFGRRQVLRQLLPHLAWLERSLGKRGSRALTKLPVTVLQRALEQLESMQSDEPNAALAVLRTRLVETIALRSVMDSRTTGVEVREVTISQFSEVERSWTQPAPLSSGFGSTAASRY